VSVFISCPIPAAAGQPHSLDGVSGVVPPDLSVALRVVRDPRARRGRRHQVVAVLAVGVCAVLAGARSYVGIAEWARDLPWAVRAQGPGKVDLAVTGAVGGRERDVG